jgi:Cu2+-containing amine oxidase
MDAPTLCQSLDTDQPQASTRPATHPLQPLTAAEFRAVIAIIHTAYGRDILFETIKLLEAAKPTLAAWTSGDPIARAARTNIFPAQEDGVHHLAISLAGDRPAAEGQSRQSCATHACCAE